MKKRRFTAAAVAATCLLALTLAGCGGTNDVKSASEPLSASQAFSQESVWVQYDENDAIEKDGDIERILVFDGNGNVTAYLCNSATFADVNGLSDDEIIELAKEQDKEVFDTRRQTAIDSNAKAIEVVQSIYDTLKEDYDNGTYATALGGTALSDLPAGEAEGVDVEWLASTYSYALSDMESILSDAKEGQAAAEAATYQEPQAQPYTLHIETDGTGNSTQSETISFDAPSYSFATVQVNDEEQDPYDVLTWGIDGSSSPAGDSITNESIQLSPIENQTVYDMTFGGFGGLATIVNDDHAGFTFDAPDTEGIEVD